MLGEEELTEAGEGARGGVCDALALAWPPRSPATRAHVSPGGSLSSAGATGALPRAPEGRPTLLLPGMRPCTSASLSAPTPSSVFSF